MFLATRVSVGGHQFVRLPGLGTVAQSKCPGYMYVCVRVFVCACVCVFVCVCVCMCVCARIAEGRVI